MIGLRIAEQAENDLIEDNPLPGFRLSVSQLMAIILFFALILGFIVAPVLRMIEVEDRARGNELLALGIINNVQSLAGKSPQGVDSVVWRCVVSQLHIALSRICFSSDPPAETELIRLRDDLAPILSGPLSLRSLESIWSRIARTSPSCEAVIDELRPSFEACLQPDHQDKPSPAPRDAEPR